MEVMSIEAANENLGIRIGRAGWYRTLGRVVFVGRYADAGKVWFATERYMGGSPADYELCN